MIVGAVALAVASLALFAAFRAGGRAVNVENYAKTTHDQLHELSKLFAANLDTQAKFALKRRKAKAVILRKTDLGES